MENTITRISDLPSNNNTQISNNFSPPNLQNGQPIMQSMNTTQNISQSGDNGLPTNYTPMNIHPNPYGISAQNPILQPPQQANIPQQNQAQSQYLSEEQKMQIQLQQMQHQRLPSRDIPQDTAGYYHDEQVQANYIPKSKVENDYVREHEETTEKNMREYQEKKKQQKQLDSIYTEFQVPIFIAILFFLFQLPIINTLIFKRFSFLSIHNADGNFNFYGLLLKSIMFGSAYYSIQKITTFLSEI